ncbi:MAG: SAM-dependent methyltransferase [Rhodospirillaceae bacterium]|jgi:SAM-dependent methyltransferase|nr:SAM-dependent methyltransferase [Rhodospirillaceae bacterium]MBT6119542.1 SAM-dependent methyltransferase [Rhodospirillaceae bacterium]
MPPATTDTPPQAPPSPWVLRFAALIPAGGPVLDLATGGGRHARLLAARGHPVLAVDRDAEALVDLAGRPGIACETADLEASPPWSPGPRRFAGIVVTNYLWRPLLATLPGWLEPGGILIYETFAQGNERFGRPRNPDFLLRPGELTAAFAPALRIVAYEHGAVAEPRPAVIQRICAAAGPDPHILPAA